ncbi:MFS transporter [Palaeococcus sp. (in: euryarchaeotes)]
MDNRDIWFLHLSTFFFFLAFILVAPLISPLAIIFGATPLIVGTIASISSIVSLLLKPLGGFMGDRGRKFEMMMLGALLGALAGILYISSIMFHNLLLFTIGRAIHGMASAFFYPASLSSAIDLAPPGRVGETLGWRGTMFSISQLIGPALGGFVADYLGFQSAFILTVLLSSVAFSLVLIPYKKDRGMISEKHEEKASYRALVDLIFISASLSLFFMAFAYSAMYTFLPALYKVLGFGTSVFGVYASIMGGFSILTRVFGGREADRRGPIPVATVGLSLLLLAYLMLLKAQNPPMSYWSAIPLGMGFGLTVPALQMLALADLPKRIRSFGAGIYTMFFDLGYLSGPLALGYVAQVGGGYGAVFSYLPILITFSFIMAQLPRLKHNP